MFFLKKKNCSNPECFIYFIYFCKKYSQRSFRCENFNCKRPRFFELRATELAIRFIDSQIGHPN